MPLSMNSASAPPQAVVELLERSHRLGSDPRNTNYAGGNTSCKTVVDDPVTGKPVELLYVKGSGGDLGTLTEGGLAALRLDRLRALVGVYPGPDHEDDMVAAFDFCLHGKGGAAPSIDTPMHALVSLAHVDHLHPDAGIALATSVDGEDLTRACFGHRVLWVPWRRPGFQLGLDIADMAARHPEAIGVVLGGHGITAWGATSAECESRSLEIIRTAEAYIDANGRPSPFGAQGGRLFAVTRYAKAGSGGGPLPVPPRAGQHRFPPGRALHRQRHGARFLGQRASSSAGHEGYVLPGPLPAHQGAPARARPPG